MKALETTRLEKTCGNGFRTLKGIDLVVNEGDFFALPGPNGAGKSTAIGVVASPAVKSAGRIQAHRGWTPRRARRRSRRLPGGCQ